MKFINTLFILNGLIANRISNYKTLEDRIEELIVEVEGRTTTCSGVLYKPNIILTASNCIRDFNSDYHINIYSSTISSISYPIVALQLYNGFDNFAHNLAAIKINRTSQSNKSLLEIDWRDYGSNQHLTFLMLNRDIQVDPNKLYPVRLSGLDNERCKLSNAISFSKNDKFWSSKYNKMDYQVYYPLDNFKAEFCTKIHEPKVIPNLQVLSGSPLFLDALVVTPILVGINNWGNCWDKTCLPFIFSRMSFMKEWIEGVTKYW